MSVQNILTKANRFMVASLVSFVLCTALAYGLETALPLLLVGVLHVAQILLAGAFKVAYVVRIVCQKQLGLDVR